MTVPTAMLIVSETEMSCVPFVLSNSAAKYGCECTHDILNTLFDTGRAGRLQQVFEELISHESGCFAF